MSSSESCNQSHCNPHPQSLTHMNILQSGHHMFHDHYSYRRTHAFRKPRRHNQENICKCQPRTYPVCRYNYPCTSWYHSQHHPIQHHMCMNKQRICHGQSNQRSRCRSHNSLLHIRPCTHMYHCCRTHVGYSCLCTSFAHRKGQKIRDHIRSAS